MTEEQNPDDSKFMEELQLGDFQEYEEIFKIVGDYKQGNADLDTVHSKLFSLRFRQLQKEDLQKILDETDLTPNGNISFFNCIILLKKLVDNGTKEKLSRILKRQGAGLFRTKDPANYTRTDRNYCENEKNVYAKMINKILKEDPDCQTRLPIDESSDELFEKLKDGVFLDKLVNKVNPENVPDGEYGEELTPYQKWDNITKGLEAAQKMGCSPETMPEDVADGNKGRVEDLLGDLLAKVLLPKELIKETEATDPMVAEGEDKEALTELSPDDFLKKWVNVHLANAGEPELTNFGEDVKDSQKYTVLLHDLCDECDKAALEEEDLNVRAEKVIENSTKIGTASEVTPADIVSGEEHLNRIFVADMFNAYCTYLEEQKPAGDALKSYIEAINKQLVGNQMVNDKIPIDPEGEEGQEIFTKIQDGKIISELQNIAQDDVCNTQEFGEDNEANLAKTIEACEKMGIPQDLKPNDIILKKPKKIMKLLGDILDKINCPKHLIKANADTENLIQEGEDKDAIANLLPEDFLKRWINYHLKNAGQEEINNFSEDLKGGDNYIHLLGQIAPNVCDKSGLELGTAEEKCAKAIEDAKKMGLDLNVTGELLAGGDPNINRLFAGNLYNLYANPFSVNEKKVFAKLINKTFEGDDSLAAYLPLDPETNDIFPKAEDGKIYSKLCNYICPGTVDERVLYTGALSREDEITNVNLVLNSAKSIGCFCDVQALDLVNGKRKDILEFFYSLLKLVVFKTITIQDFPQLLRLKGEKEEVEEMLTIDSETILIRWFNMHLKNAGYDALTNFGKDVKDSKRYLNLLNQISSECDKSAVDEADDLVRADAVLTNAEKIGTFNCLINEDIVGGSERLNLLYTAEIFNANIGMSEATSEEKMLANRLLADDEEGEREERTYRIWINSLKIPGQPKVNNLYEQCRSGVLLLKIIDKIQPGSVNWKIVDQKTKNNFKLGVNCQEVIDSCKKCKYHTVGIGGLDIRQGVKKMILAIVWQLMRAHTLQIIGEKSEEELIAWANERVQPERKIKSLKDKSTGNGLFWLDIIASIEPRAIRWDLVTKENASEKDLEMNAKYALSAARGLGGCIFIVWEDITQVKSRLLLTFLASLYDIYIRREKAKQGTA